MFDEGTILHNAAVFLGRIRPNLLLFAEIKELYDAILSFNSLPDPVQSLMEDLKAQKIETLAVILHQNGIPLDIKIWNPCILWVLILPTIAIKGYFALTYRFCTF